MTTSYVQRIAGSRTAQLVVRPPRTLFAVRGDAAVAQVKNTRGVMQQGKGRDVTANSGALSPRSDEVFGRTDRGMEIRPTVDRAQHGEDRARPLSTLRVIPATIIRDVQSKTRIIASPTPGHSTVLYPTTIIAPAHAQDDPQQREIRRESSRTLTHHDSDATRQLAAIAHSPTPLRHEPTHIVPKPESRLALQPLVPHQEPSVTPTSVAVTPAAPSSQVLVPASPSVLKPVVSASRAPRDESPTIHIGTVEIKMSSPERHATRKSSAASASSLTRGTFTSFGIRQG